MNSKGDADKLIHGATLALMSGKLTSVESNCRKALEFDPDAGQAYVLLGIVAQREGRIQDSIQLLTRAIDLQPNSFDAASCLAAAYRISENLEAALPPAELAVKLRPRDATARIELGSIYIEALRLIDAEPQLRQALTLSPGNIQIELALNQCLEREGKSKEALQILRFSLSRHSLPLEELLRQSSAMISQSNPRAAVEFAREACRQAPYLLRPRALLARSLVEAGDAVTARTILEDPTLAECRDREPDDSESMTYIGMAFQSLGQIEKTREWLKDAIQSKSPIGLAYYSYAFSTRMTKENEGAIKQIEKEIAEPTAFTDLVALHFALGKSYEDLGNYQESMSQYDAANRSQVLGQAAFDRKPNAESADDCFEVFNDQLIAQKNQLGNSSELPIQVFGMIRSGTTLMEQILSSHEEVGGAGEVPFWIFNSSDAVDMKAGKLRGDRLKDIAKRYVNYLTFVQPGKRRVVDKMPINHKYAGIVHVSLPKVKFVHMRRDPLDTCLSIYTTHTRALSEFGRDKDDLVRAYRHYQKVTDRWRELIPSENWLDIDYEELVASPEPVIRKVLAFCGLDWDERCLNPETNSRAVATPSLWQVRRPINSSSVGRWQRFEPWLGELKQLLPPI